MNNLETLGVVALNNNELANVDGGILLTAACIGLAALYLYSQTACLYHTGEYQF